MANLRVSVYKIHLTPGDCRWAQDLNCNVCLFRLFEGQVPARRSNDLARITRWKWEKGGMYENLASWFRWMIHKQLSSCPQMSTLQQELGHVINEGIETPNESKPLSLTSFPHPLRGTRYKWEHSCRCETSTAGRGTSLDLGRLF